MSFNRSALAAMGGCGSRHRYTRGRLSDLNSSILATIMARSDVCRE
jgi:hypothetical protein